MYEEFPQYAEGELAKIRAHVVSRESCEVVARCLGLGARLAERCGDISEDELARLTESRNVLAALVEAALGALYIEHGFERIRAPVLAAFADRIEYAMTTHVDYKTELQEELARRGLVVSYSVVNVDGPPHERTFTAAAVIDGEQAGVGEGPSKKEAEQKAARRALEGLD